MLEFRTQGFQGYGIKYSPFYDSRIAVAASSNYGLVGQFSAKSCLGALIQRPDMVSDCSKSTDG